MKTIKWISAMLVSAFIGGAAMFAYTAGTNPDISKLEAAMQLIESRYVEPVNASKLIDGAIDGMLQSLEDPYTTYMDQEESKAFYESINASFEGIGATMEEVEGRIVVVAPLKGSPAEAAGIKPGDQVIKAGGKILEGMKVHEAVMLIRGKKGTKAELTIVRNGKEIELTIVRDTIPLETVYSEMKEDGIGVIRLSTFAETTAEEYEKAVKELISKGMKGLVLDLRQNPGGLTNAAERIASTIVKDGEPIVQFKRRGQPTEVIRSKHIDIGLDGLPIVALMDGGSASAAEILAGALRESADIPLVGEKSFGKGTAQASVPFQDGSNLKFTVAEWLTPDGGTINKKGLLPDIVVKLPAYASIPLISTDIVMKENDFSDEIKYVQAMLKAAGYNPGREDGFFDKETKAAVLSFQSTQGLDETGIVTGETTKALILLVREIISANDTQLNKAIDILQEQAGVKK
jgi:carboxyl-terminal processing protease